MKHLYLYILCFAVLVSITTTSIAQSDNIVRSDTIVAACGSYLWHDSVYTQSGDYVYTETDTIDDINIVDTLHLTVNPLPEVTISGEHALCSGSSTMMTASGAESYVWNTTESTSDITVTHAGIYTVVGTDSNGCTGTASVEVVENPAYQIPIEAAICIGESYTLNGFNVTPELAGTTTHVLNLQTVHGCDSVVTLTLTTNPLPEVSIIGENSFCAGESTILTASGATTYIWNMVESAIDITVIYAGSYTVVGTDANGCTNTASVEVVEKPSYRIPIEAAICANELPYHYVNGEIDTTFDLGTPGFSISNFYLSTFQGCDSTITLALTVYPSPVPFITGDMQFCSGEGTSLTAIGGIEYAWSTGETTDQIYVFEGNVYAVTVTDEYGCIASTEVVVEEIPSELEQKNVVSKNHADGTPYMLVYPQADLLYQWFKNGEQLVGETRQYYTPSSGLESNILYTVHVRPQTPGGCGINADWSWDGTKTGKVSIVPNPNDGHFTLLLPVPAVSVAVYSASGEEVFRENMSVADRVDINAGLSAGLYLLKIIHEDGTVITEKLVISQ